MNIKYDWDFSSLYKNEEDLDADIKKLELFLNTIKDLEGKLTTKHGIIQYLEQSEQMMKIMTKLEVYAMMKVDLNTSDAKSLKLYERIMKLATDYSIVTAFVQPELSTNSTEFLESLKNNPKFTQYARVFETIIREKQHTISKDQEEIIAGMGNFTDFSEIFEKLANAEIPFKPINIDGKDETLSESTYSRYIKSSDPNVRRQAYENLLKGYSEYNLTISQILLNKIKQSEFISRTYKFNSTFDRAMFNEEIDSSVYDCLVKNVNENLGLYQSYLKKKASILQLKKLHISDIHAPIGNGDKLNFSYEQAVKYVLDVVGVLGEEYQSVAKAMFENGSIDVFPKKGKRSGGYSVSAQNGHPYILLNYNNSYFDFSTIIHELGHSMHSYYSEKEQPYYNQNYVIFVAEIASTVNEVLLAKKLLKDSSTKEEKVFIVDSLLGEFCSTVFRQTMFSEFEFYLHSEINKGNPISYEELNEFYGSLQNKYFKDSVTMSEYSKYEWSRIPHFYRPFYVFKYATGFISAVSIAKNIEEKGFDYVENKYKKFLSAGASMDPISILKMADVDITSPETYKKAFEFFNELLMSI